MSALEAAMQERPSLPLTTRGSGSLITFDDPVQFSVAWGLQLQFHAERLSDARVDTLMLLEHLPVYTAGRRTKAAHLKPGGASSDHQAVPIETVSRGGSVTYHGPGQLIGYPILAVSHHAPGAKVYVYMLEEVLIRTLLHWDIHAYRVPKAPGVWTRDRKGEAKIASIGARIDRGITLHGFALNVCVDLRPFSRIVPCGLDGCRMTSIAEIRQASICVELIAKQLAEDFSDVFQLEWTTPYPGTEMKTEITAQPLVARTKEN